MLIIRSSESQPLPNFVNLRFRKPICRFWFTKLFTFGIMGLINKEAFVADLGKKEFPLKNAVGIFHWFLCFDQPGPLFKFFLHTYSWVIKI